MTVVHVRMDNRLIHGQILVAWSREFRIDHLIVTNDGVAADPLQVTLLKAVAPIGSGVSVLSVKDTVAYCQSPKGQGENIFIIAKYPEDGLGLIEGGLEVKTLNLGNQAFVRGSKKLSNSVFLTEQGVKALNKIHDCGIRITCRMMPNDAETDYWPTLSKAFADWL